MENSKKHDLGTKLLNELMVDIIGALIPGVLFIIVVILSVVLPLFVYYDGCAKILNSFLGESGFWWVLLIVCIFFAYVVGHIFYRADISVPDKKDVKRQVECFLKRVKKSLITSDCTENIALYKTLLKQDIEILEQRLGGLSLDSKSGPQHLKSLKKACGDALNELNTDNNKKRIKCENIHPVLFPEDIKEEFKLSPDSENVIKVYKDYFASIEEDICSDELLDIVICYCILHNQMEIGCATADRCEFPYTNYYKYLLKRNLMKPLQYVDWYKMEDRTKNKINSLKVQIQIFANEAYPLINKNESHIRMSSSTWHMSSLLLFVTIVSSIAFAAILLSNMLTCCPGHICLCCIKNVQYMAVLLPITMFLLVFYIKRNISHYIHYQRMREIQYTLQIYDQFKDIIEYRRNLYSGKFGSERETD